MIRIISATRQAITLTAAVALALTLAPGTAAGGVGASGGVGAAGGVGGVSNTAAVARTPAVRAVTPFFADGRVRLAQDWSADFVLLNKKNCGPSLVTRAAGVYSCGSGAGYLPACWVDPSARAKDAYRAAFCLRTPGDRTFIGAMVDGPLPAAPKGPAADPWRIVLANGARCDWTAGVAWATPPPGMELRYWCSDDSVLLAKAGKAAYSADTVLRQKTVSRTGVVKRVTPARVVYAGAAPAAVAKARTGASCPSAAVLTAALPAGSRITPKASEGIFCVARWAYAAYSDGMTSYAGIFRKTAKGWTLQDRTVVCQRPGPVPAAIYIGCTVS